MSDKIYISSLTWRTRAYQAEVLETRAKIDNPSVYHDEERDSMVRPTTRTEKQTIFVSSLAVLSDNEGDLTEFVEKCKKQKIWLHAVEESFLWYPHGKVSVVVSAWRVARKNGAAKIGARISADRKMAKGKEAAAKIADRWPMSSDEWPTRVLLEEAGISLNTAKAHLGKRPIAQYNYQAKMKRKANAKR